MTHLSQEMAWLHGNITVLITLSKQILQVVVGCEDTSPLTVGSVFRRYSKLYIPQTSLDGNGIEAGSSPILILSQFLLLMNLNYPQSVCALTLDCLPIPNKIFLYRTPNIAPNPSLSYSKIQLLQNPED